MGYRSYIGWMTKREYNKIKKLSHSEFLKYYNEEEYVGLYDITNQLYNLGSGFEYPPKNLKLYKNFFTNKELKERYEDYDPILVNDTFLKYIIERNSKKINDYYQSILSSDETLSKKIEYSYKGNKFILSELTDEDSKKLYEMYSHIKSMSTEWEWGFSYNLDKEKEIITSSWKYEYSIFELVRIYKTFDWKKNVMICYGY